MNVFKIDWLRDQGELSLWLKIRLFFARTCLSVDYATGDDCCAITTYKVIDGKIIILDMEVCTK